MSITYAQKNKNVVQTKRESSVSIIDTSSQSESLQRKADMANNAAQRAEAPRPNNTGMPDNLKAGIENLSGFSMDNVRVHYNSSKPATVQALAYTQGTDIHVAPGQEKHLPHEAWHVAQQMAGRVSPTTNINGMPVNDNGSLEHEADVMGEKAVQCVKTKNVCCIKGCMNADYLQRMPLISELTKYNVEKKCIDGANLKNGATIELMDNQYANVTDKVSALDAIIGEAITLGKIELDKKKDEFFNAVIGAKYKTRGIGGPVRDITLKLKYQFRANGLSKQDLADGIVGGPGYITEVTKSKKNGMWRTASMINGSTTADGAYRNAHELSSGSVLNNTYNKINDKTRTKEESFKGSVPDAYTKLAGEGARFQCVRRNMKWIRDDTVFYKSKDDPKGVMFSELWKTWSASFENAYDIDDNTIATKMGTGNTLVKLDGGKTVERAAIPGNCVLLDGKSTVISEYVEKMKDKMREFGYEFKEESKKWEHTSGFFIEIAVSEFKTMLNELGCNGDNSNQMKIQLLKSFMDTYKINVSIPNDYLLKLDIYEFVTQKDIPVDSKKKAIIESIKVKSEQPLTLSGKKKTLSREEQEKIKKANRAKYDEMINSMWIQVLTYGDLQENVRDEFIKDRILKMIDKCKGSKISLRRFRNEIMVKFPNKEIVWNVYHKMLANGALTIEYGFDDDRPTVMQSTIAKGKNVAFTFLTA